MLTNLPSATSKVIIAVGAVVSVALDAGHSPLDDLVARALLVGVVAAAGREADRRTHAVAAAAALLTVGGVPAGIAATVVAVVATVALMAQPAKPDPRLRHALGAVSGAAATLALLHQGNRLSPAWAAVVTVAALTPMVVSGIQRQSSSRRRRMVRVVGAAAAVVVVVGGVAGLVMLQSRSNLEVAVQATEQGLAEARAGDVEAAIDHFAQAEAGFANATSRLQSPVTAAARWLPVVGDNLDAATTASAVGHDLAASATDLAEQADYRSLRVVDGRLDLDRVEAMGPHLTTAQGAVGAAQATTAAIDRTWLVGPLAQRVDRLDARIAGAQSDLRTATDVLDVVPALLGGDGPRHWYVMFTQPAEARFGGGFVADYAIVRADDGTLEVIEDSAVSTLTRTPGTRTFDAPEWYTSRYGRYDPARFFENHTAAADQPINADVAAQLVPQTGRPPIDGVVVVDPAGIAGLLELTGPVTVPDRDEPLTADNVEQYLLIGQYAEGDDRAERKERLHDAGKAAFEALLDGDGPSPGELARVLGPAVAGGHLSLIPIDERPRAVFDDIGLTGRFNPPATGDWVSVRHANGDASKLDAYLDRHLDYRATVDDDGALRATATVELTNAAPDGLPAYVTTSLANVPDGTNRVLVSVLTPHDLETVTVDGRDTQVERGLETDRANAYTVYVDVPRGATVAVAFTLTGRLPGGEAAVTVLPQPAARDLTATVTLDGTAGSLHGTATVTEPHRFTP